MSQILLNCTHRRFMVFRTYMIIRHIYLNSYHWLILCPYHRESNLHMGKYPCAWYIYIIKVIMSSLDCFSPLILCHPVLQGVKLFKRPTYQHRPVNFVTVSWGATMRQLILSSGCRGDYHQPWGSFQRQIGDRFAFIVPYIQDKYIYIYMLLFHCSICDIQTMLFFLFMFLCMYHVRESLRWINQCEYMNYCKFLPVCWQCIHTCQLLIIATAVLGFPPFKMVSLVACFPMSSWL